jgi:GNAT superfamily N-acetyltransferase
MSDQPVQLRPIEPGDLALVGHFLSRHLNPRLSPAEWAASIVPPWIVESPNHGFQLVQDGELVGVHLAFYSRRLIDGAVEDFCNLGAFCVLEPYRSHGIRLLRALLAQPGYSFTDLSPSGAVVPLNQRLRFSSLDTATVLIPSRPVPWPRRTRVIDDPDVIEARLTGADKVIFEDHRRATAARHLLLQRGDRECYVIFRHDRRKGVPAFASILHVSDRELFADSMTELTRHLLLRHGVLCVLGELRVIGARPSMSLRLTKPRPKMYRSTRVGADAIDYLYSELTCVAW